MTSAFGIEHVISKYSREYGTANVVPDHTTRRKLRPLPNTEVIKLKRKRVAKSYTKLAPKLMAAAAKGDRYASQRLAAGSAGKTVNFHQKAAKEIPDTKGIGRFSGSGKARKAAQTNQYQAAALARGTGNAAAQAAKKTASSISAVNYAAGSGVRGVTEAKPKLFSTGNKIMGASVLGGAGVGGGAAVYANQRRKSA